MADLEKIYPITTFNNVIDADTNNNLYQYLANFNHLNLGYCATKEDARNSVGEINRKKGLYITYYLEDNPITEVFIGNKTQTTTEDWINDENWQYITETELLNNIPHADEEDITEVIENNKKILKLADRKHSYVDFIPRGIKTLRRNVVYRELAGVQIPRNILTQDDFKDIETIYIVKYTFNLEGATIEMPLKSTILLYGGTIANGTIVGNNTDIIGTGVVNVKLKGTFTKYGVSLNRPDKAITGTCYFDTSLNKPIWWQGAYWVDSNGNQV